MNPRNRMIPNPLTRHDWLRQNLNPAHRPQPHRRLARAAFCLMLCAFCGSAFAQGTAFTYQGRLDINNVPLNGTVALRPTLWDASSGGSLIAGNSPTDFLVTVTNGLFTATLNFGAAAFNGQPRWLEWEVSQGGGPFTTLTPRQPVTPTPYAMIAGNITGVLPNSSLPVNPSVSGTVSAGGFAGSGAGLTGLNASELTTGTVPAAALGNAWKISGNAGTTPGTHFLGTTDNQPVDLRVNNQRVARFQISGGEPALLGGFAGNVLSGSSPGSVIVGGGSPSFTNAIQSSSYSLVGGGRNNQISAASADSLIVGGANHRIEGAFRASIVGGDDNAIQPNNYGAFLGAGIQNRIHSNSFSAVIVGGQENQVGPGAGGSVIGGGQGNRIDPGAQSDVLGGGFLNRIGTNASYNFLGGGYQNSVADNVSDVFLGGGRGNKPYSTGSFLGGGQQNTIFANSPQAVLVGGNQNVIGSDADQAFIGGGQLNSISYGTFRSAIVGGYNNTVNQDAEYAVIGGGSGNTIAIGGDHATIPGGRNNTATAQAFAAGTRAKANHTGAFVWADSTDADFASTANNQFLIRAGGGVGIGTANPQGQLHLYSAANPATVRIQSTGTPGFGRLEFVSNPQGDANEWRPGYIQSTDAGGFTGGLAFYVNGTGAGNKFGSNEVMRIQNGRVGIGTNNPTTLLQVGNATCNGNTWVNASDRALKENLQPVNTLAVLEKVSTLSLSTWNYKSQDATIRHLGPMAQDFKAAFGLGESDTGIATLDADGVALAAIQGLNQKLTEQLSRRDAENAALKARLEKLEQLLESHLNGGVK